VCSDFYMCSAFLIPIQCTLFVFACCHSCSCAVPSLAACLLPYLITGARCALSSLCVVLAVQHMPTRVHDLPGMIGQPQLRAGMKSALIILYCLFASGSPTPVPSGSTSCIAIDWCFVWLQCIVRKAMLSTHLRAKQYAMSGFTLPLCCLAPFCTRGVVGGVVSLPCLPCRIE
jgi:hypothetical protein